MLKVFLSYSRADKEIAESIRIALEDVGMKVFDSQLMTVGSNWRETTIQEVLDSDIGLVLISPVSAQSPIVRTEVLKVKAQNKRLYAALIKDMNGIELPSFLQDIHYVDLTSETDYDTQLSNLVDSMLKLKDLDNPIVSSVEIQSGNLTIKFAKSISMEELDEIMASLSKLLKVDMNDVEIHQTSKG